MPCLTDVMPLPFVYVCDLLDALEKIAIRDPPHLPRDLEHFINNITVSWLQNHRRKIDCETDANALTAVLFPERTADRVYDLDAKKLEQIIARVLGVSNETRLQLQRWRHESHCGDLAVCVQRVMQAIRDTAVPAEANRVTIEDIDDVLLRIASQCKNSSEAVRSHARRHGNSHITDSLAKLYHRLQSREAKWLTRLILKDYAPVKFPKSIEYMPNHSSIPNFVRVQAEFPSSHPVALRREGSGVLFGLGNPEAVRDSNKSLSSSSTLTLAGMPCVADKRTVEGISPATPQRIASHLAPLDSELSAQKQPNLLNRQISPFNSLSDNVSNPQSTQNQIFRSRQRQSPSTVNQQTFATATQTSHVATDTDGIATPARDTSDVFAKHPNRTGFISPRPGFEKRTVGKRHKRSVTEHSVPSTPLISAQTCASNRSEKGSSNSVTSTPSKPRDTRRPTLPESITAAIFMPISPVKHPKRKASNSVPGTPSKSRVTNQGTLSPLQTRIPGSPHKEHTACVCQDNTGVCQLAKKTCPLSNCIFLLGPCLANYPWVTENLIPWHGARFITNPRLCKDLSKFSRNCPKTGKTLRKIALVESHRTRNAIQLMQKIDTLKLRSSNGSKEWVEVYDCVY